METFSEPLDSDHVARIDQEVATLELQPSLSFRPPIGLGRYRIGYFSTLYTKTLASSIVASVDSGTGGVKITCFGAIT